MLARTLYRQGAQVGRKRWRPLAAALAVLGVLALGYLALPTPGPRLRQVTLTDDDLRAALATVHIAPAAAVDAPRRDRAALGRSLFLDPRLGSGGERACATCHDPQRAFSSPAAAATAAAPVPRDRPSIANTRFATWFNWDGRADSLVSQALGAIEDPEQLGTTRVAAVRVVLEHYRKDYETAFGPVPAALAPSALAALPAAAKPAAPAQTLSVQVAAHALATIGAFDLMRDILASAQAARRAPAKELSRRALGATAAPEAGTAGDAPPLPTPEAAAYAALSAETRTALEQVYVNIGRALAAYEQTLVAIDSPFDRFARRVLDGTAPRDALASGFGETELVGLQLFLGPGRCALCHAGPGFSDQQFHNIGLAAPRDEAAALAVDVGRATGMLKAKDDPFCCLTAVDGDPVAESCRELPYLDTENLSLVGAYKTPSLRNVSATAPYMHDGRFASLRDVLEHYNTLEARAAIGTREGTLTPLDFTDEELDAVAAFLGSLASGVRDLGAETAVGTRP